MLIACDFIVSIQGYRSRSTTVDPDGAELGRHLSKSCFVGASILEEMVLHVVQFAMQNDKLNRN
jgi:hypothetical protein